LIAAIDAMDQSLTVYDADDRLLFCNKQYRRINSVVPENFTPGIKFADQTKAILQKGLVPEAEGREDEWLRERVECHLKPTGPYELMRQNGIWLDIYEQRLPNGGSISLATDITARRRMEEDLRLALGNAKAADESKTKFLGTMSHELRTPLNAIIGFSETMARQLFGDLGSKKYVEYAHDIKASGEHLLNLINDLLDLSAIEAGKRQLNKESLNFQEVVEACVPIIAEGVTRKEIVYTSELQDNLPIIHADRRALTQVFLNLLSNATKFTPENGEIALTATATNDVLIVKVQDTGMGIPEEKIDSLTDPFVRGEPDPYKSQEGTGLGLAIVKSLVELHEGDLIIESEVGVGTTVTVTLPHGEV
jgi:two-component system, cell cycle sensor histidine kinase PleC